MPGGTENSATSRMSKTYTLGGGDDGGDEIEPGDSASATGKAKGGEFQKAVGAMFDSMVPLKSKSKSKRSSSDSDDNGKAKKRRTTRTNPANNTENTEARGYYCGVIELIIKVLTCLILKALMLSMAENHFSPMIKRNRLENKLYRFALVGWGTWF